MAIIELVYVTCVLLLSIYGLNNLALTWLYLRRRGNRAERGPRAYDSGDLPIITVQLPIYNELHTVERLLEATAALRYPTEKLEIQLLDDSTDETSQIIVRG